MPIQKITVPTEFCIKLEELAQSKNLYLEGNVLKVLNPPESREEFIEYIKQATQNDNTNRKKRINENIKAQETITKLQKQEEINKKLMNKLKKALILAENAQKSAENDLDIMQKRREFELIGNIVNFALYVIGGVGIVVTIMYISSMIFATDQSDTIGSTWSNLLGILLTNSFSIVGTIMGVRYASEKNGNNLDNKSNKPDLKEFTDYSDQ